MDGKADLDAIDRDALERCMEIAKRDPETAAQLESKLQDDEWVEVAEFACYGCQLHALNLKPWQSPPVHIDENADEPNTADREPNTAARKLLRQMLAAGVSRYDPDPLTALNKKPLRRKGKRSGS